MKRWDETYGPGWGFKLWFIFCAILALASIVGVGALVMYVLPHVIGMMDRIH